MAIPNFKKNISISKKLKFKDLMNMVYNQFYLLLKYHNLKQLLTINILHINWMPINNRIKLHTPHHIVLYIYEKYIDSSADLCINISSKNT